MKKALLTLAAFAMASSAFAQGTILFFNNNLTPATGTTVYRAGIFRPGGTVGAGDGYTAGIFLASDFTINADQTLTTLNSGQTADATALFRTTTVTEVFAVNNITATIAGTTPGQTASLIVAAWETGKTFNESTTRGYQVFTSRALGGPDPGGGPSFAQPDMGPGFTGFTMFVVPEPSTIALGVLGVGALLLRRRKA